VAFESIVSPSASGFVFAPGVTAADFAVPSWRLISEGDSFRETSDRCDLDVVPQAPFEGLCELIDADPGRTCSFVSRPDAPHCSAYLSEFRTLCVDWFEGL
jgi:hypothetical protein